MKINHSSAAVIANRHAGEKEAQDDIVGTMDEGNGPDDGPTMSQAGAMPSGSEMAHWDTGMARADATRPASMPKTKSAPMPGEKNHESRNAV